jgi:hypothetical protein
MRLQQTTNGTERNGQSYGIARGLAATLILVLLDMGAAAAQTSKPIVYPSGGQSLSQQSADEGECRNWSRQQTGFDPASAPQYVHGSGGPTGHMVGGAARGAALGAVGGAIGGDAGKGAAIGAGVGATAGLLGRRAHRRQEAQVNEQAQANYDAGLQQFNRAFATCMQGRHYTVN